MAPNRMFGCAALLCAACLQPVTAAAYQQSDLAGTWEFNTLASGPGAPWWERARAVVAPSGPFTAFASTSLGDMDTLAATFGLSPAGIVTLLESATFRGALDVGTTVLVGSDTWSSGSPGTTELRVGLKQGGAYRVSDLAGAWEINAIASGPGAPWWLRGRIAVAADGGFSGTFTDHEGQPDPTSGVFALSPEGVLTFSRSSVARGVLDAGRSVIAMTNTWTGFMAGTTELAVGVRMGSSYALADLAGTWELHSLATGPGAPWWGRAQISVAPDGSYTGTSTNSDGASGPTSGSFTIAPDGVMTRTGSSSARGVLDAGRSVMVWTSVWTTGSPGTTELMVATWTGGATTDAGGAPMLEFALDPVQPNPARGRVPRVRFTLANAAAAHLELLDVGGRRIADRDLSALGAGRHTVQLGEGRALAPGLYWVRLRQGGRLAVRRVVLM